MNPCSDRGYRQRAFRRDITAALATLLANKRSGLIIMRGAGRTVRTVSLPSLWHLGSTHMHALYRCRYALHASDRAVKLCFTGYTGFSCRTLHVTCQIYTRTEQITCNVHVPSNSAVRRRTVYTLPSVAPAAAAAGGSALAEAVTRGAACPDHTTPRDGMS